MDLGGHRLHVNCTGTGSPVVVVENGLGDFSFDWLLVQSRISRFTRICTYDRAGYAWSDAGPMPRTFAQLNLELRDALRKLGERDPFVLVGHSFGGPVVRNFALAYPQAVAGMVLVDSAFEGQRVGIGGKTTSRLGGGVRTTPIPLPTEHFPRVEAPRDGAREPSHANVSLDPMYRVLPPDVQKLQFWAQSLHAIEQAEDSQREWSAQYFAEWLASPQAGKLGNIPLLVLTRAKGGYRDGDYNLPASQLERERQAGQANLTLLSTNSRQIVVDAGHNMELDAPDDVTDAIRRVVAAVRADNRL